MVAFKSLEVIPTQPMIRFEMADHRLNPRPFSKPFTHQFPVSARGISHVNTGSNDACLIDLTLPLVTPTATP